MLCVAMSYSECLQSRIAGALDSRGSCAGTRAEDARRAARVRVASGRAARPRHQLAAGRHRGDCSVSPKRV